MQYKIPQDVQMEDKIVGPLTLRQLMIVAGGGGISYFIYLTLSKVYILQISVIFAAPIALLTLAVAFIKIHGISFVQYVFLTLEFYFKPRKRIWEQGAGEVFISITQPAPQSKDQKHQQQQQQHEAKDLSSLEELTKSLDDYSQMLEGKSPVETSNHPN